MKIFFCFIDKQDNLSGDLICFIQSLESKGNEVYLYTDICEFNNDPNDVLYTIDTVISRERKETSYIFLSNVKNFFQVIYRLYHQTFDQFIYYHQEESCDYPLNEVYQTIYNMNVVESEMLYKPVYTNTVSFSIRNYKCLSECLENVLEADCINYIDKDNQELLNLSDSVRKYYYINSEYYLFEPILTEKKIVIHRKNDNIQEYSKYNESRFHYPGYSRLKYRYNYPEDMLEKLFVLLNQKLNTTMIEVYDLLETLENEMKTYMPYVFRMTCCILDDAAQFDNENSILRSLLLYSFLMQVTKEPYYLNQLITISIHSSILNCDNRYHIWNQCKRYILFNNAIGNERTGELMQKLYVKAFQEYAEILSNDLLPIPKEERDRDAILVFTIQFLSEQHAPTRTTLERCYTLAKLLGKKILLINTKEQYTNKGTLLLYNSSIGTINEKYSDYDNYEYKDLVIPFYQPSELMPSVKVIKQIIDKIREIKPYFIFSIGNGSMVADLCGRVVPEAAISVAFSTLATTMATFSVIGKKITELEWSSLINKGYQKDNIIEGTFTFELAPRKKTIKRADLNIPIDQFILVTVGIRLDFEVDDEFIETIQKTFAFGTHIVFAGYFDRYDYYCEKYPEFRANSTFVGYCNDIIALMNICDLYVNPRRLGGGFSIVEAFHEGKPGVTIDVGDIAIAAGPDFCVKDYQEMIQLIERYTVDPDFYYAMSQKAIIREKEVTDSTKAMTDIIVKIQENPLFF